MDRFSTLDAAASGMSANRMWLDIIAANMANAQTSVDPGEDGYRAQRPIFQAMVDEEMKVRGVTIDRFEQSQEDCRQEYIPGHKQADENGMVTFSNVNVMHEMADMLVAQRAFEANATVFESAKDGAMRLIQLLQA
ncbi:flagellar basal body rod protein FlgC [bacterium]|nr:flagellar basal body rod protein FlgC [bacterium]UNM08649.1 MAG: flagellar basal body rod protein FlgC [Planctomycetales bacterium]